MNRPPFLAIAAGIAIAGALCPAPVRADQFPGLPAAAVSVDDTALGAIRGKFVPPEQARASVSAAFAQTNARGAAGPLDYRAGHAAASPLAGISGTGPIVYFGIAMTSTWSVTNGGITQGVQLGATLNIDVQHHTASIGTWSQAQNGGLPAGTPTGSSVSGAPPASNISSGVGQSIQVAGNGNVIANQATVSYGSGSAQTAAVPASDDCGSACSFQAGPGGFGIAISTPQGAVSQNIGPNGIVQSAQVWSDLNHITNRLGVNVQTAQQGGAAISTLPNASQIVPVLPSIAGIP